MSKPGDRIIDRDVEFYEGEIDFCENKLRQCIPSHEAYWTWRLKEARKLVSAFNTYRNLVNEQENLK